MPRGSADRARHIHGGAVPERSGCERRHGARRVALWRAGGAPPSPSRSAVAGPKATGRHPPPCLGGKPGVVPVTPVLSFVRASIAEWRAVHLSELLYSRSDTALLALALLLGTTIAILLGR